MGAGGIIQQRAEIKAAIGPETVSFTHLSPDQQEQVKVITDKGFDDWTDDETTFAASMVPVAVNNALTDADPDDQDDDDDQD